MPHYTEYRCTGADCGKVTLRELLTAKKVNFSPIGPGAKIIRSRTVAWLCDECLEKDVDYNAQAFKAAPGLKSPALERVRAAEERNGDV